MGESRRQARRETCQGKLARVYGASLTPSTGFALLPHFVMLPACRACKHWVGNEHTAQSLADSGVVMIGEAEWREGVEIQRLNARIE